MNLTIVSRLCCAEVTKDEPLSYLRTQKALAVRGTGNWLTERLCCTSECQSGQELVVSARSSTAGILLLTLANSLDETLEKNAF